MREIALSQAEWFRVVIVYSLSFAFILGMIAGWWS